MLACRALRARRRIADRRESWPMHTFVAEDPHALSDSMGAGLRAPAGTEWLRVVGDEAHLTIALVPSP